MPSFAPITLRVITQDTDQRPIDFTLKAGESVCLRGANGTGKTALLSCLAGVPSHPDHAEMTRILDGQTLRGHQGEFQALLHWQSHRHGLAFGSSILEEWQFWHRLLNPANAPAPDLPALAAKLALSNPLHQDVASLSAGEKQKVALARLFLAPRPLWILDEPESHLDQAACALFRDWVREQCAEGGLVLFSSHLANPAKADSREIHLGQA